VLEGTSMTWVDTLALRKGEKIVDSWQGIREVVGGTFEGTLEEEKNKKEQKRATVLIFPVFGYFGQDL